MGVLNRLIDMTKAAANEMMDKLEEPGMMLNHYVRNMQTEIDGMQAELHKQEAAVRIHGQQAEEAARIADMYDAKAMEAITNGLEAAAREALAAKLHYTEKAHESAAWQENAKSRIAELNLRLEDAKAELKVMQKKREELVARMQQTAAKAHTSAPSFSYGFEHGSAARGFQRMEDKINQWEAYQQVKKTPYGYAGVAGAFTAESAEQSAKDSLINEQLEQLRKRTQA